MRIVVVLPGAVQTEEAKNLTRLNIERQVLQCGHARVPMLGQAFESYCRYAVASHVDADVRIAQCYTNAAGVRPQFQEVTVTKLNVLAFSLAMALACGACSRPEPGTLQAATEALGASD